jgi:DtxR family transcriptional regulator, Mn-dependent transcriptional regulator
MRIPGEEAKVERPSPAVQDYLKAIYQLGESGDATGPITTSQVAETLSVTTASASNMLKKLDGLGYVTQVKRQGVELTEAGRQAALEVVRHHRLLETYLATRLGMSWDEVHREAEVLEHHVSSTLAARIAEALGHPERDPHGHPIPTSAGQVAETPSRRLSELPDGARAVVGRVDDRDDALLRFLAERGLVPGARVEVLGHAPFGGPISVRVDDRAVDLPPAAADAVHVE